MPRNARLVFLIVLAAIPVLASCSTPRYGDSRPLPTVTGIAEAPPAPRITLGPDSSLADLLAYAQARNPGIQSARTKAAAAAEKISQARFLPDPMLEFEQAFFESTRKITISQMFPNIAKIAAAVETARWNAELGAQAAEVARNRVRFDIKSAYFDLYLVGRRATLMEEDRNLMLAVKQIAEAKYQAGLEDVETILKIQVDIARIENDIRSMQDMAHPMSAMIRASADAPADFELQPPVGIPDMELPQKEGDLVAMLASGNPQLQASDLMVSTGKAMLLQARAERRIDITVALMVQHNAMGDDMSSFMVGINLPMYREKYEAMEREAQAEISAAELELKDMRNMLNSQLSSALFDVRDAQRRVTLYTGSLIPLAEESLKVSQKAFAAGKTDYISLVESLRALIDLKMSLYEARAALAKGIARVEFLVGRDLVDYTAQPRGPVAPKTEEK